MRTFIRIYNKRTGDIEDVDYPDVDSAFSDYWKLSECDDPDVEVELITSAGPDDD